MTDLKLSDIYVTNPAAALTGGELIEMTQGGLTVVGLASQLWDYANQVAITTKTASATLALSDGNWLEMDVASANTLTVPPNSSVAFPVGSVVNVYQKGAGQTTVVAGAGVTVRTPATLKCRAQYSTLVLVKRGTDEWVLAGDVAAS